MTLDGEVFMEVDGGFDVTVPGVYTLILRDRQRWQPVTGAHDRGG